MANAPGTYYSQVDYGLCSEPNITSNRVVVTSSSSGSAVTVNSSLGNPFCAGGNGTVLTATSGNSYVWKKNGTVISGATTRSINANESAIYTVDVDFGGCVATGTIDLKSNGFTASLNVPEENKIIVGETLSVSVTTDAVNPSFEWYLNNTIISGANGATFQASKKGTYKVIISQNTGCLASVELPFKISFDGDLGGSVTKIANILSLSSNLYSVWDIPAEYKNPETQVIILSSNGDMVVDTVNYQGDWPAPGSLDYKIINPVYYYVIKSDTGEKKGSITVIK